jgi:hypothetical protein
MKRLLLALLAVAAAGCARDVIPNTDVEDTSQNRDVLEFCEQYRTAVERRDIGAMLSLVSETYLDDNGTPSGDDDVDFDRLAAKLAAWRDVVLDVRYEIRYRRVIIIRDKIHVNYTYSGSFRVETGEGERWARRVADNRLTLVQEGEAFRIVSGL